ncbi:MAG: hypothetical protein GY794_09095 [bacterium]|nr:hypothetical protein [bacterium]
MQNTKMLCSGGKTNTSRRLWAPTPIIVRCIASAIVLVALAAVLTSTAQGAADRKDQTDKTIGKTAGKWYYWGSCYPIERSGYGGQSLWFGASGMLWRYDVKTRKVRGFTSLDGLPLTQGGLGAIAVAPDETCVIRVRLGVNKLLYLWRPKTGWRRLPGPDKRRIGPVTFDPDSRLYCIGSLGMQTGLFRLDKGAWVKLQDVPACQRMAAIKKGVFLSALGTGGSKGPVYVDAKGGQPIAYDKKWRRIAKSWHIGDKTFGIFRLPGGRASICQITPEKIIVTHESKSSGPIGPDLTGKGYLRSVKPAQFRGEIIYGIGSTTDSKITKGFGNRIFSGNTLRDANGHIWCGSNRWDGAAWKTILPPQILGGGISPKNLTDRRFFALDDKTMTWRRINGHVPPAMHNTFDPTTQTAWWHRRVDGKEQWQLIKFDGAKRKVLRTVAHIGGACSGASCKDSAGNYWDAGRNGNKYYAIRFDPQGKVHTYPSKPGIDGGLRPQIQCSPKGNAWLWNKDGASRYDPKLDKFVIAEPWEDFAFRFGPWRLSMAGEISSCSGQKIRRFEQGVWKSLSNPFGGGVMWGNRNMIWRDRILLSAQNVGVLEYDAKDDRWAILHESPAFKACFDAKGRRILVNVAGLLMFDGDPLAPSGIAARDDDNDNKKDSAVFSKLLKLMDDDSWRVRDTATNKLKKLYPTMRRRLKAAAKRKELPLEVKIRIKMILEESGDTGPIKMPGLFERMHPSIK